MRVIVTGSSGCLAAALLPRLCADPEITGVTGIDIRPARFADVKFQAIHADISAPHDHTQYANHDALIHMAYVVLRGWTKAARMRHVNVDASLEVLERARASGMKRLIVLSSAAAYGYGTELAETAPLVPRADFLYAAHKAELEARIEQRFPRCLRLRPHVILGPNAQPLLRFLLRTPLYPHVEGVAPQLQCIHEADVVSAIMLALRSDVMGAINLASADTFSYAQAIKHLRPRALAVRVTIAQSLLTTAWRLTGFGGEPAWLDGLTRPLTLDCGRARQQLGWLPAFSALDALSVTAR